MLRNTDTIQMVEDLIDTAGTWIGYWASSISHNTDTQTCTVVELDETEQAPGESHTVTFSEIALAMKVLIHPETRLRGDLKDQIREALTDPSDADIDAEAADVIIQQAALGEVVYG